MRLFLALALVRAPAWAGGEVDAASSLDAFDWCSPELVERVRGATIIGLGDSIHGSHEFDVARAALSRCLLAAGVAQGVAIETSPADVLRFGEAVESGARVTEAARRLTYWTARGSATVGFLWETLPLSGAAVGFDVQSPFETLVALDRLADGSPARDAVASVRQVHSLRLNGPLVSYGWDLPGQVGSPLEATWRVSAPGGGEAEPWVRHGDGTITRGKVVRLGERHPVDVSISAAGPGIRGVGITLMHGEAFMLLAGRAAGPGFSRELPMGSPDHASGNTAGVELRPTVGGEAVVTVAHDPASAGRERLDTALDDLWVRLGRYPPAAGAVASLSQTLPRGSRRERARLREAALAESLLHLSRIAGPLVAWAHADHVSEREGSMGGDLRRALGSTYVSIGMLAAGGRYLAAAPGGVFEFKMFPATPWSVEACLARRSPAPRLVPGSDRCASRPERRSIGSGASWVQFTGHRRGDFDLLLWLGESSPLQLTTEREATALPGR